jgi:UDP-N-acetylglucosamine diphosphorylase/glucosamine-1-phosphate N-acetyltransferase
MDIHFIEEHSYTHSLLPFTALKPVQDLRVGIFTLREKWSYFSKSYALPFPIHVSASLLPSHTLFQAILCLKENEVLCCALTHKVLAYRGSAQQQVVFEGVFQLLQHKWEIFLWNDQQIRADFEWVLKYKTRAVLSDVHTKTYNEENIFIEEGAQVRAAVLNAEQGPIYLAKGSEVQEGALIRGSFALLEHAVVAQGTKVRGSTTVGPRCKVGGEINNTVFMAHSNKGHDGYIGNSVVGEWCNLAAATNVSNMKNNHSEVSVYNYATQSMEPTGLKFCGVFIGDYSRVGIGTTLNTGTVMGVGVNLFNTGFPPKFVPDFSWGTPEKLEVFQEEAWYKMAEEAMKLKQQVCTPAIKQAVQSYRNKCSL